MGRRPDETTQIKFEVREWSQDVLAQGGGARVSDGMCGAGLCVQERQVVVLSEETDNSW